MRTVPAAEESGGNGARGVVVEGQRRAGRRRLVVAADVAHDRRCRAVGCHQHHVEVVRPLVLDAGQRHVDVKDVAGDSRDVDPGREG